MDVTIPDKLNEIQRIKIEIGLQPGSSFDELPKINCCFDPSKSAFLSSLVRIEQALLDTQSVNLPNGCPSTAPHSYRKANTSQSIFKHIINLSTCTHDNHPSRLF